MEFRWSRNLGALTESECLSLKNKTVFIVGCGGLGGYLAEYFARLGIGEIRIADGDEFEASNLNRQLLSLPEHLGKNKAQVTAERIRRIDHSIECTAYNVHIAPDNAKELFSGCDAILDAVDNDSARIMLSDVCAQLQLPLIHGAISGWTAQAAISAPGDNLIHRLYENNTSEAAPSSLSFTPALCAAMQAALCTKLLSGRAVSFGKLYMMDLLDMEFQEIELT